MPIEPRGDEVDNLTPEQVPPVDTVEKELTAEPEPAPRSNRFMGDFGDGVTLTAPEPDKKK